jgi:hypothetical protein
MLPDQLIEIQMNQLSSYDDYLVNDSKGTAIKIPQNILSTIRTKLRLNTSETPHALLMSNIISTAIQLRAYNRNFGFEKHLTYALSNTVFNGYLTKDEISDMVEFFSQIPEGYTFTDGNRIWAHSEIGSTPSF